MAPSWAKFLIHETDEVPGLRRPEPGLNVHMKWTLRTPAKRFLAYYSNGLGNLICNSQYIHTKVSCILSEI
ncbi:hypothetical protein E2C01_039609 [Portunus trituberculatus]|uniref:Uncharacterized protein n=1 Tax=Portunus trituberculatus TaxID=210409 RepID=A0A5B7FL53_PORTR|nr:hypothetical protein [Portunus trituberculatus]